MLRLGSYEIDDNPVRVDVDAAWAFLSSEAYWGRSRSIEDVRKQIGGAWRIVGCYDREGNMVGLARAVSDGVAVAYLADVYVLSDHRGHGLGVAMVQEMIENGTGRDFRWMLHTRDAHGLYRKFGFAPPDSRFMERTERVRATPESPAG
jgi:GNAT superfamily N-acetyltransferase